MTNMNNQKNENNEKASKWMGSKGFDEARYYKDEKYEIGIIHSDEQIRAKVLEAFSRHPSLAVADINVEVKDGLVILEGSVQGQQEKHEAYDLICHFTGVKAVRNDLQYQPY